MIDFLSCFVYELGMIIKLSNTEKEQLEIQHKKERDSRVSDRIKAVLLNAESWTQKQIAQALRIRYETVQDHLNDYQRLKKLKPENGGSKGHLSLEQTQELIEHLEETTYLCQWSSKIEPHGRAKLSHFG